MTNDLLIYRIMKLPFTLIKTSYFYTLLSMNVPFVLFTISEHSVQPPLEAELASGLS